MVSDFIISQKKEMVVLVVDDDAQVRSVVAEYLQSFGIPNVIQIKDGQDALNYINEHSHRIDLMISDWEMPKIDGLVLLKAVRSHPDRHPVKFIMITSQNSVERIKITQARICRVDAYIIKPFRGQVLKEKIYQVMNWEPDDDLKSA